MRIIAGLWRGRALTHVGKGDARALLRPTTDRNRESLFSILAGGRFGDPLTAARVLDVFAGTGALGLEALSRGAKVATFVENGRRAQRLIDRNIDLLGAAGQARLHARDARKPGQNPDAAYDLVFLDPPYGAGLGAAALSALMAGGWVGAGALIVWEEAAAQPAPEGCDGLESRRFGDTWISFLRATRDPASGHLRLRRRAG